MTSTWLSEKVKALHLWFGRTIKETSTSNATFQAYDQFMTFIVNECTLFGLEDIQNWTVPGLFISYNALEFSIRPYVHITYILKDGEMVYIIIPKDSIYKLSQIGCVQKNCVFGGIVGFKIDIAKWHKNDIYKTLSERTSHKRAFHFFQPNVDNNGEE